VSETLLLAFIPATVGAASAILSAYLTNYWAERRFQKEREWALQRQLKENQLEAYKRVNAAMVDCHYALNYHANVFPKKLSEFKEEVLAKVDKFEAVLNRESLWLSAELQQVLNEVRGAFRQVNMAIFLHLPQAEIPWVSIASYSPDIKKVDWQNFATTFDKARKKLRMEIGVEN